ncbi:hypothetical protein [Falsiroseomonas sp. CW058]|uniref:hypothetical protein n=1 Tax=Falsiroseomonas sp. CW058 TaxID=3388664 RepID=UPI003D316DBB
MGAALLRRDGAFPWRGAVLVLLLALAVIGGGAALRSTEYDETYTRLVTSPVPRPDWPATPFTPAEARPALEAVVGPAATARNLRETDVHPPLYFWAAGVLRGLGGTSVGALRALSVACALGAVLAFMAAAHRAGLPPLATGLATALSFGFAYTGGVARGFALAHLLLGLGALAVVLAWRRQAAGAAAAGGLAAGLASFANYLAAFPAAALVGWLLIAPMPARSRLRLLAAAALPFGLVQIGNLWFFLAQRGSRTEQFEPFAIAPALTLLGQFNAASLFGGLPLYVEGPARLLLGGALVLLLAAAALAVAWRWRALGPTRWLWLGGFAAPSAGLLLLGAAFGNTPIELRYLAFAAPFAGALLAGAAAALPRRAALPALGLVLAVQAAGAAGMVLHPATQQTFRDAFAALSPLLGPRTLLLVPRGNDGVGIVGAVLAEAPPDQRILLLREDAPDIPAPADGATRLVLLAVTDRDGARQVARARAALAADPAWREAATPWRDARRGFTATVYEAAPRAASRVADRAEGVLVRRAHHGGEQP